MWHAASRIAGDSATDEPTPVVAGAVPRAHTFQPPDEELLLRIRRGETAALDMILARYWLMVVDYIARLIGARDAAQDIAQRTFLQLWDRREHWHGTGSLRALLCHMARNFAFSERRRTDARERSDSVFHRTPRHNPTPEDDYRNEELRLAIEQAVAALPERRREVFVLHAMHGLPYKEIAEILGISPQTVANQLSSALRTLRGQLGDLLD
jgi:RNA polymerase sigma-70 factor, ECF subfamily